MNNTPEKKIKLLTPAAISKIAAGEVIERPASVVKELVENALDAEATQISIGIKNGGITLIEIEDNGCGINKEDLPLAITNHATSKISPDNIDDINCLGFRGEALASIVHVAKVQIISKIANNDLGNAWEMEVYNGTAKDIVPSYREENGTLIRVSDLFSLTPNRLRFLPSKQNEIATITALIQQFALSNLNVGFKLKIDGKIVINLPPQSDISERIVATMGNKFWEDATHIQYAGKYLTVSGYTSVPTACNTRGKIVTFVNGRIIKDPKIYAIIKAGYNGLIEKTLSPSAVVFIETDKRCLDVNVHPHKTQVRFSDEMAMKRDIIEGIKNSLAKTGFNLNLVEDMINKRLRSHLDMTITKNEERKIYDLTPLFATNIGSNFAPTVIKNNNFDADKINEDKQQNSLNHSSENFANRDCVDIKTLSADSYDKNHDIADHFYRNNNFNRDISEVSQGKLKDYTNNNRVNYSNYDPIQYKSNPFIVDEKNIIHDSKNQYHNETNNINDNLTPPNIHQPSPTFPHLNHGKGFASKNFLHHKKNSINLGKALYQIDRLYVVAVVPEEEALVIVDQHAAHERIVLEQMKRGMKAEEYVPKQMLLFPEIIDLPADDIALLLEQKEILSRCGFDISVEDIGHFYHETERYESHNLDKEKSCLDKSLNDKHKLKVGEKSENKSTHFCENNLDKTLNGGKSAKAKIHISSIPAIFGGFNGAKQLVNAVINCILATPLLAEETSQQAINTICGEIACHSSIRAGKVLSLEEMNALLRAIEEENFTSQCNHGRPTFVKIFPQTMGKFFDR